MADKNFFTDGNGIYRFEGFETIKIAVLKNLESGIIAKVPRLENGKLKGFKRVELRRSDTGEIKRRIKIKEIKISSHTISAAATNDIIIPDPVTAEAPKIIRHREPNMKNNSPYYGVSLHKISGKYRAQIGSAGPYKHLGTFVDPIAAAKAVDAELLKRGQPARNFP